MALDMQGIPAQLAEAVNDYKMHIIQVLESDKCSFRNPDVHDFFEIMRSIYRREYQRIEDVYGGSREISVELGLVIGVAKNMQRIWCIRRNGSGEASKGVWVKNGGCNEICIEVLCRPLTVEGFYK